MYDQFMPHEPVDRLREGLPNLRHGTINQHPLEILIQENAKIATKNEFATLSAMFGKGFADHIRLERKAIKHSQTAFRTHERPSNLGMEISTGEIDDLDFCDMFAPNGQNADIEFDPHEIQEIRLKL